MTAASGSRRCAPRRAQAASRWRQRQALVGPSIFTLSALPAGLPVPCIERRECLLHCRSRRAEAAEPAG